MKQRLFLPSLFLFTSALTLTAHAAPAQSTRTVSPDDHLVARSGDRLSGELQVGSLHIPFGVDVVVEDDLELFSFGDVRIDGRLVAADRAVGDEAFDGPALHVLSRTGIHVTGEVLGGRGRDAYAGENTRARAFERGGDGSRVQLEAAVVIIDGRVVGGMGGRSAPHAKGGRGGEVSVVGRCVTTGVNPLAALVGGAGGECLGAAFLHEYPAGSGGDGAGTFVEAFEIELLADDGRPIADEAFTTLMTAATLVQDPDATPTSYQCPHGVAGANGAPRVGGAGANGPPGAQGSSSSPNGQTGGTGGNGTNGTGTNGSGGANGQNCCHVENGIGGNGGMGGQGGTGTGGPGGRGGQGGNGYFNGNTYTGAGGKGGTGGNGGVGTGGNGGDGGDGGRPWGKGGTYGSGSNGYPGPAGHGGPPGWGGPNNNFGWGAPGSAGGSANGVNGAMGQDVGNCQDGESETDE